MNLLCIAVKLEPRIETMGKFGHDARLEKGDGYFHFSGVLSERPAVNASANLTPSHEEVDDQDDE